MYIISLTNEGEMNIGTSRGKEKFQMGSPLEYRPHRSGDILADTGHAPLHKEKVPGHIHGPRCKAALAEHWNSCEYLKRSQGSDFPILAGPSSRQIVPAFKDFHLSPILQLSET